MAWRYEIIATQDESAFQVLDGGRFKAADIYDTRSVLAAVLRTKKTHRPKQPDAIRLIDPKGNEVWRARLSSGR